MKPRLEIRFPVRKQITFWDGEPYLPMENREFLLDHARSGILISLKAMGLPEGSDVGVMVYNCHTVFNAVVQAGYHPVFIDVTEDLRIDLEDLKRKSASLKALVVTHLFGFVNDIECIREAYPRLYIIEDCAHAMGITSCKGDFAVYSIGQGKLPSLGDGGILTVLNPDFLDSTIVLYKSLPEYSTSQNIVLFFKLLLKSALYHPWIYGWLTRAIKKARPVKSGIETISPRKMSRGIRALYQSEYRSLDLIIQKRKNQSKVVETVLQSIPEVNRVLNGSVNAFMAVCECKDKSAVQSYLSKRRIDSETHFSNCIHWASSFGYGKASCPNSEKLCKTILTIPTYCTISF